MRVFVLGGTGRIGAAVVRGTRWPRTSIVQRWRGTAQQRQSLAPWGRRRFTGDIGLPQAWAANLPQLDAVIHMACDFKSDMAAVDHRLLDGLLPALAAQPQRPRFIYTGGCWLYGATGNVPATEATPFHPLPAFAWMVPQLERVLASKELHGIVVHPAMVYGVRRRVRSLCPRRGGGPAKSASSGAKRCAGRWCTARISQNSTRWRWNAAPPGESYIGAAIEGIAVGRIARAFARASARHEAPQIVS